MVNHNHLKITLRFPCQAVRHLKDFDSKGIMYHLLLQVLDFAKTLQLLLRQFSTLQKLCKIALTHL